MLSLMQESRRRYSSDGWNFVASFSGITGFDWSSDGNYIALVTTTGLHVSDNGGSSFSQLAGGSLVSVGIDDIGEQIIYVSAFSGGSASVFYRANSSGSFSSVYQNRNFSEIALSGVNSNNIVSGSGGEHTCRNFSFTNVHGGINGSGDHCSISKNGVRMMDFGGASNTYVVSIDSGASFSLKSGEVEFGHIKNSGNVIAGIQFTTGVVEIGKLYKSTDSASTFTQILNAGIKNWFDCDCSDDLTKMIASEKAGYVYLSTDSGVTWTQQTALGVGNWKVRVTPDGTKFMAVSSTAIYKL